MVLTQTGAQVVLDSLKLFLSSEHASVGVYNTSCYSIDWYNQVWSGEDCEITGEKSDNGGVTIHLLEEIH